ncbi:MAG: putative membrane protein YkoI [Pseudohongiellaceae bacterium]
MKFKRFFSILAVATLLMLPAFELLAQNLPLQIEQNQLDRVGGARPDRVEPQANVKISERQAVGLVRDRFAGNVLRIGLVGEGNRQRYQIRMENEGKVFTVFVNAASGRVTRGG